MKPKGLLILILLAALAAGAAWLLAFRGGAATKETPERERLAPALSERGGETARVEIVSPGGEVAIEREGGSWVVASKGGYPADGDRVRRLVTSLSELRTVEPKTANPELHDRLAVQWPVEDEGEDEPGGVDPTLVRLLDEAGEPVAEIVLGERSFDAGQTRRFARLLGEDQSWLVSADVDAPTDAMRWMNRRVIELERERVRRVTITHPDGAEVTLARDDADGDFAVENVPGGMEPISEGLANRVGSALSLVNFTDVEPASGEPEAPVTAVYETFDGLTLTLHAEPAETGAWVRAEASGEGAEAFNERLSGWRFRVPTSTADRLTTRPEDVLREVEPEQGPAPEGDDVPELLRPPGDG